MARLLKIVFSISVLSACAKDKDYRHLTSACKEAVQTIDNVQRRVAGLIRPFLQMMDRGIGNVSEEYWNAKVIPELQAGDKELQVAVDRLYESLPKGLNPRKGDPKDEPWLSVYDIAGSLEFVDLVQQGEIYDSEYIMLLMGA